ncbi:MAG: DUF362 domain-containing protein [Thermoleophilia bacterium]|nr:DUF362 domain-containing protein [Thermoleophilia bacterium]
MGDLYDDHASDAASPAEPAGPVVAAVRCADYDAETLRVALGELLAPLGGMAAFVRPGERIALKPNILFATSPDRAIITHPELVGAVASLVKEAGAHPVVVESPGTGVVHVRTVIERAFRKAGYQDAAERYGFELCFDTDWEAVSVPEAVLAKRIEVLSPILQVDGVINLAKFKTHMFMIFTGATKNLFGVIPGLNKAAYHARLNDRRRFAEMLLDVACFVRPRLNIVDGILAMEGDGPGTGGKPRHLGVLLAGADMVAVDVACCRIAGIDASAVPVLAAARDRGMWSGREDDVETLGVPLEELRVKDFVMPGTYEGIGVGARSGLIDGPLRRVLRHLNRMPRPKAGRCTLCAACERGCPAKAITVDQKAKVAKVDDSLCIRCYCCHEVCPSAAIDLEFAGVARLLDKIGIVG